MLIAGKHVNLVDMDIDKDCLIFFSKSNICNSLVFKILESSKTNDGQQT